VKQFKYEVCNYTKIKHNVDNNKSIHVTIFSVSPAEILLALNRKILVVTFVCLPRETTFNK